MTLPRTVLLPARAPSALTRSVPAHAAPTRSIPARSVARPTAAALLAMALSAVALRAGPPSISFFRERVQVEVLDPGDAGEWAIAVHGVYHFRRPGPAADRLRAGVFYPFPLRDGAQYPDEISVSRPGPDGGAEPVPFVRAGDGVSIPVVFPAGRATTEFTVDYRQRTGRPGGVYITTTTRAWQRPLERAEFVVRVPDTLRLTSISYPPDRTVEIDGRTVHTITMHDFMPAEDLELEWKRRE